MAVIKINNPGYKPDTLVAMFHEYLNGEVKNDGEEYVMYCPLHEDPATSSSPSASLNPVKGSYYCFSHDHGGPVKLLIAEMRETMDFNPQSAAMKGRHQSADFRAKTTGQLKGHDVALPSKKQINAWTSALLGSPAKLATFKRKRGLTEETIQQYHLGWDAFLGRYTIPVYDDGGHLLNVRKYKIDAGPSDKMRSITGHGGSVIYLPDVLSSNDEIVVTEGELDALLLNQVGIPAVSGTGGSKRWMDEWNVKFTGKVVFICYDADEAGRAGAIKVRGALSRFARQVHIINLPASKGIHGYDVTDYLHGDGYEPQDFRDLMDALRPSQDDVLSTRGRKLHVAKSLTDTSNDVLEIVTTISGKVDEPYPAPAAIRVTCAMDKGKVCLTCPLYGHGGDMTAEVRADDPNLLQFVEGTETKMNKTMAEMSGAKCTSHSKFEMVSKLHIYPLTVQPSIDDTDGGVSAPVHRTVFSVTAADSIVRTNEKVRLVGRNVGDPRNNQLRFHAWHQEPMELDLDQFKVTPEQDAQLRELFWTDGSPLDKCLEIAADLSQNVTHIFDRDLLHVGYDLVWHSPLTFTVAGQRVHKGWLEMLVVGDTRTGKSEIAERLRAHYRSGRMVSCEGMSFAGILGGLQQFGSGRFEISWGVVPMYDRRLVVLDEVSGITDKAVIEKMSSVRSSGIAQIVKIRTEETQARTRIIWISNPPNGGMIADQPNQAVGAMRDLAPNAEDQARFDLVMATSVSDVDSKVINQGFHYDSSPEYISEACERLVKWAWSLKNSDVVFSDAAARAATDAAVELGARYLPEPPLIQAANARYKILRIAAALAARTYHVSPKTGKLHVDSKHVKDAVRFLDLAYGQPAMGYARMSEEHVEDLRRAEQSYELAVEYLDREPHIAQTLDQLREGSSGVFTQADFRSLSGTEGAQPLQILMQLHNWRMLTRQGPRWKITSALLKALAQTKTHEPV